MHLNRENKKDQSRVILPASHNPLHVHVVARETLAEVLKWVYVVAIFLS